MKNICKIIVASFFFLLFFGEKVNAQDPHFSQFYHAPMHLNPGLTGLIQGDIRAVANYRSQWGTIATPFTTMSASVDMAILNGLTEKDIFGGGLLLLNDVAGEAKLRNTYVGGSLAYHKSMNGKRNHFVGLGAQYMMVQQSVDFTRMIFESQFNGEFFDPSQASGENFTNGTITYFDFSAGLSWGYRQDRFNSYYAGVAVSHINQPRVSIFDNDQEWLFRKYTIYAGGTFKVSRNVSLIPRGIYLVQGSSSQLNVGAMVKFNVGNNRGANDKTAISFGTMHRWKDAQVIIMRYDYERMGFSFSYDVNISKLNIPTKGRGAVELAFIYTGFVYDMNNHDKIICPKF
ncbi:MAG: PorP/SprF family type IX secretion system membrane protein [Bacteroidota bacterium]